MKLRPTIMLDSTEEGVAEAANIIHRGGLVAFATETVYGLGANAKNDMAVASIFAAKGRPSFNPLIIHLPSLAAAEEFAEFNDLALSLARNFWAGPFTMVLPVKEKSGISKLVNAGLSSIALRVPAHPLARDLLEKAGVPVAAPSANPSGTISPTSAAHVRENLAGKIDAVLDGGVCKVGLESTVVEVEGDKLTLLRPGGVTFEMLEKVAGKVHLPHYDSDAAPHSPGRLPSHYAPHKNLRINASFPLPNEVFIGFGKIFDKPEYNLSAKGDLIEAAANLFAFLNQADSDNLGASIAVAPIPEAGIGLAINDRLKRAAAPR